MSLGEDLPFQKGRKLPPGVPGELLPFEQWVCDVAARWQVEPVLIRKAAQAQDRLPFHLLIISGYRTQEEQDALREEGRPAAPDALSTHRTCPATGMDLWPKIEVTDALKAQFLAEMTRSGLRVGGGSPIDPDTGIPEDWNHVDLGPRR